MRRTLKIESLHANSGLQIHNSKVEDCKSRPAGASTTPTRRPRLGVPDKIRLCQNFATPP
jgi:hypothetical protein